MTRKKQHLLDDQELSQLNDLGDYAQQKLRDYQMAQTAIDLAIRLAVTKRHLDNSKNWSVSARGELSMIEKPDA